MENIKYITTKEAASVLGKTTRTIIGLCQKGKLNGAIQKGRNWKIPEDSVLAYVAANPSKKTKKKATLPLAVGNTSYTEIANDCYYVDKTLLIRDLLDHHSQVTLFTRPRRFGKTLAINMLKTFFEKSEEDTSRYFYDKKIWGCGDDYRKHQGKYPVIILNFKDIKFTSWEESFEALKLVLRDEYMRHSELFSSSSLNAVERKYLEDIQNLALSDVEYTRGLANLTRMLEKHHHEKAIILIDEYDTPIQQGHSSGFYDEVITFMRNFMSGGLKDNPSLSFGILTGILRVSKENLFSGLNNPVVDTVLDENYSEYFGFTEAEVIDMASYYGQSEKLPEIRTWYDGYRFGRTEIYNPWSVTNYFSNNCQPKTFWANTSDNTIIRELLQNLDSEIADELSLLLQGKTIQTNLNMEVIYPHISDGADMIFSFLLVAGYLKPVKKPVETEFATFAELALPNKEIQRVYNTEILAWLKRRLDGSAVSDIEKALYLNQSELLQKALRKYMLTCISSFDGSAEGFYHGMMLGLVASLSSKYYIRSNRESGEGRFDLCLEPKNCADSGIIMEFKAVKADVIDNLSSLAGDALTQIEQKHYDADMKNRGIQNITKYGIAFCGKNVEVCV
jgi:excisionase family DNA binding protein